MNNLSINAFEIYGEKLKSLIFASDGVLIHDKNNVTFIPSPMTFIKTTTVEIYKGENKVVFASFGFDKIKQLSNNERYIVWIAKNIINIHRADSYEFVISIYGRTL